MVPTYVSTDVKVLSGPRWSHELNIGPRSRRAIEKPTLCLEKCNRNPLGIWRGEPTEPVAVASRSPRFGSFASLVLGAARAARDRRAVYSYNKCNAYTATYTVGVETIHAT